MKSYICAALLGLFAVSAQADLADYNCEVKVIPAVGKAKKNLVPRQAHVRISKDVNARFVTYAYSEPGPIPADIVIQDAHTLEPLKIFTTEIKGHWKYENATNTPYGVVSVRCQ